MNTEPVTLRSLAAEYLVPPGIAAYKILELIPEHHDLDAPLRPRVEEFYRLILDQHCTRADA
jgi:hypothetical protein